MRPTRPAGSRPADDAGTVPTRAHRTVPIGDYGFLSDGEVTALVAPGGSVDWMCLPRMDSPSVFGSILGRHAGTFRVAPDRRRGARPRAATCPAR